MSKKFAVFLLDLTTCGWLQNFPLCFKLHIMTFSFN